ncbi:MAG: prepilin-type N-terminal cleavage/methylation domain-containing protein [Puniceicoccales bacterium]|jgi:prepilin-type processing-associated H-X9-DG protein|nr:prepilin-type N-terminal cleavage/methylation domain-containing protein [Puniceicoccales bacterium]
MEYRNTGKSKSKSFTLVEIVFTISIIGILLAILLPAMSAIKLSAQKVRDVSNLKRIAEGWREYVINRGFTIPSDINHVTVLRDLLVGIDRGFSEPDIWLSSGDKYGSLGDWWTINNFMIEQDFIISYCFMADLPVNAPLETTPLGFTRGLNKNGLWDEKAGIYGSKGGYVLYADGHVTWFDGSKPAKFLKWDQSGYTNDIRQTVRTGITIICCNRGKTQVKPDYKGENARAILYDIGTGGE